MKPMTSAHVEPADLLDLKLLPAWVKEPADAVNYEHYAGEDERWDPRKQRNHRGRRPTSKAQRPTSNRRAMDPRGVKKVGRARRAYRPHDRKESPRRETGSEITRQALPEVTIR